MAQLFTKKSLCDLLADLKVALNRETTNVVLDQTIEALGDKHLYLLGAIEHTSPIYDKARGFVVRASSDHEARQLAADRCGDEGRDFWLDSTRSTCAVLEPSGPSEVVCRDFYGV